MSKTPKDMSTKVLTPICIKCGNETLLVTRLNVSLQIGPTNNQGLYSEYERLDCCLCEECEKRHGTLQRVVRIPGKKYVGFFNKEPLEEVQLF